MSGPARAPEESADLKIVYPPELPVTQRREDIAAAIRDHQVVIIAGETGSGKTTQIPKICLELGRGRRTSQGKGRDGRERTSGGLIGHTQPRRIAARSVAERIAEELGTELGDLVGYQVRFTDRTSRSSRVKLMTDGILLAELQRDRMLRRYDTIIIDEAHERSLNIDFLLGYLRRLLPKRPDLKLVITSATIDPERFARHFADRRGKPAPIIEVSGRTYPVELRYRPLRGAAGGGRGGRGGRPGPDRGDRRRRQGAVGRGPRRHPGLPARRAGDPGHRRRAVRPGHARHRGGGARDRPALLAALGRRAAPGVPAAHRPPGRARHQRRRDLADRAGDPVRRRQRRRPDQPLLRAHQGPAAAGRADQPGLGEPAVRPLRPRRGRHRDPALLRGGLRLPSGVHRPGDPADQPRVGDPADDLAGARGHRALPVRGAAGQAQRLGGRAAARGAGCAGRSGPRRRRRLPGAGSAAHPRRPAPGAAPDRPAAGPDDPGGRAAGLRARGDRDRGGAVAAGPARAAGGDAGAGRPAARPVQGRGQRLPHLAQPVALREAAAAGAVQQRVPADVQAGVPQLPAGAGVAGLRVPAAAGLQGDGHRRRPPGRQPRRRRDPPGTARGAALPHRAAQEREVSTGSGQRSTADDGAVRGSTSAPAARGSRSSPAAGCTGRTRSS